MLPEPEPEVLPGQVWRVHGGVWVVDAVRWDGFEHTAYCSKRRGKDTLQMPARLIAQGGTLLSPTA